MKLRTLFKQKKVIIGMIHLPPMPGYKGYLGIQKTIAFALKELFTLQSNGIHGVLLENEGDKPHSITASPEVIAAMTSICSAVVQKATCPVGVEVLLNDPKASLAIAVSSGCSFIRTDYFVDRMSRPEHGGEMHIDPAELQSYKKKIGAEKIALIADLQVKYATLLEKNKPISKSVFQAIKEGADAVLISGAITGVSPNLDELILAKATAKRFPVLIGSGFSSQNADEFLSHSDGAVVGSSLKSNDKVSSIKVKELMKIVG